MGNAEASEKNFQWKNRTGVIGIPVLPYQKGPEPMSDNSADADCLDLVLRYHRRTKHHMDRYARSPGSWIGPINPTPSVASRAPRCCTWLTPATTLVRPMTRYSTVHEAEQTTAMHQASTPDQAPPQADADGLIQADQVCVFYYGLALSACKAIRGSRWSLRVNPSSGNLHPTEGYLIGGPIAGLTERPAVLHYVPFEHGLEVRRWIEPAGFQTPCHAFGAVGLVALIIIHWRESWKYGERAYRYCQHDVGHDRGL